jgi:hypothetical protein
MRPGEIRLRASQPDRALADVAAAYQEFVKSRPKRERTIFGYPRGKTAVAPDFGNGPVSRHPTLVPFHLANVGAGLVLRMTSFEIERLASGTEFFQEMEQELRRSLGSPGPGASSPGGPRLRQPRAGPRPQEPASPRSGSLLFREGDRVRNAAGDIGTVMGDVRVNDSEMMVRIDGDLYPETVGRWTKI